MVKITTVSGLVDFWDFGFVLGQGTAGSVTPPYKEGKGVISH